MTRLKHLLFLSIAAGVMKASAQQGVPPLPHLQKNGDAIQLMVDGAPYLVLGGELHNSSSSSLAYMKPLWPKLADAHLNTVLTPVSWELIEPREGVFDFQLVDGLIAQARAQGLHLILLWFGSWKNGQSSYVPSWVKRDTTRFPLVTTAEGRHLEILSPLGSRTMQADAAAFGALMGHLKKTDAAAHTVVMIQVENEVGVLGDTRDHSPEATEAMSGEVPARLTAYLKTHKDSLRPGIYALWKAHGFRTKGSWSRLFGTGPQADEIFMAWQYGSYINHVAAAGKTAYPLPMYVNAWIVQPGDKTPGDYPSGGPQAHMHDIWKAACPEIDILAPDIYLPDFRAICKAYREPDRGFLIPESRGNGKGAADAVFAIGACDAIGYSPFGIDDIGDPEKDSVSKVYKLLGQMAPLILRSQASAKITAVLLTEDHPEEKINLGDYVLDITRSHAWENSGVAKKGYALVLCTAPDEYYALGDDFQITFFPRSGQGMAGFDYVEEGGFREGKWVAGRRLNGDEISNSVRLGEMAREGKTGMVAKVNGGAAIRKIKVYSF